MRHHNAGGCVISAVQARSIDSMGLEIPQGQKLFPDVGIDAHIKQISFFTTTN